MKKFVLVCTNENHDVASLKMFDTEEQARTEMERQYNAELDAEGIDAECIDVKYIDKKSADIILCAGEYEYYWRIEIIEI